MQTVSDSFDEQATSPVRFPVAELSVAWDKTYQSGADFFTIGTSTIGGEDVIKGSGSALAESDKYEYTDESDSLMMIEYEREALEPVYSVTRAMLDFTLDNNEDRYTPGSDPTIGDYIISHRPVRAYLGFNRDFIDTIQVFVGQFVEIPEIDNKNRVAKFHCRDYFDTLWNTSLQNTAMYTDMRTDEIIEELLIIAGLTSGQYDLEIGINTIPFAFFDKGTKLGEAISRLAEAELGRFYLDEEGIYHFQNRGSWGRLTTPVATIDANQVIDSDTPSVDNIVNVVEVTAVPRQVQANQLIWQTSSPKQLEPGETIEFFANYDDPVSGVDTPTNIDSTAPVPVSQTSYFMANGLSNFEGGDLGPDISLDSFDNFAQSSKLVFTNNGSTTAYLKVIIWGTPAKKMSEIFVRVADDGVGGSVEKYDEHPVRINNDFIQDATFANSLGQLLIQDRKEPSSYQGITIIGHPAFQLGDLVTYEGEDYNIIKIAGKLTANDGLVQSLRLVQRTIVNYFTIGVSTIGGTDQIAP